ncbi:protein-methionine sulfoxide oxidase mical3a-like [Pungitius pungitius]|uniref:protein-methionine sulfoxide oxidase mical3a-like n=1 Tax=Pungitius pungitius TaxID=134920 RepID=UPI002E140D8C
MGDESYLQRGAQKLFDAFVTASTCRVALGSFNQLCEHLQLDRGAAERPLYRPIKRRLNYWRANALWAKLDRRANQQEYLKGDRVCSNTTCVIIGAGPCGLRTAVELSFMGARVVVVEKRDSFSRNNVLHLWPFTIHDLRGLGAKKFYGKFCAGSIDHISIRQLQLVLLKVALLLGVEVHVNVEFRNLLEPAEDQQGCKLGWRMEVSPKSHAVNQLEFDVVIGADGRRNALPGFRRKEFRGKLAIAITANFKNRNTSAEAKVEEISGVAFIFNQRFFQELRQETGIDLENIVYYKDDTHYFVMTAKKQSLLEKRVLKQDFAETELLLSQANVDQNALQAYAREAADFSTNHQLPSLDFALNHCGQPDVAMLDFTCMYASENAAMIRQRHGRQLLVALVGDSLLEPFWPMGTGIARGFLAALDSAWMIQRWSQGEAPLDILADRESLYRVLPQTTQENLQKNISLFTVDPTTRYLNINLMLITPAQVRHLVDTGEEAGLNTDRGDNLLPSPRFLRQSSFSHSNKLLIWCQEHTRGYRGVAVSDLTTSWKNGLALCALIHRHRPDLIDFNSLNASSVEDNTRLSFDVAERHFGIPPLMTVDEMNAVEAPDSLSMVMYLSQFYQLLRDKLPPAGGISNQYYHNTALFTPATLLSRLGLSPSRKRNPKEQRDAASKRRRTSGESQESCDLSGSDVNEVCDQAMVGGSSRCRVRLMANQLQVKLDERSSSSSSNAAALHRQQRELLPPPQSEDCPSAESPGQTLSWRPRKRTLQQEQMSFRFKEKIKSQEQSSGCRCVCFFCQKRVYLMERLSAESLFFHRSCFQCFSCSECLKLSTYVYDPLLRRFYCLQHFNSRLSATTSNRATSQRASIASLGSAPSLSSAVSMTSAGARRPSVVSVMVATSERIELENYRRSSTKVETEQLEDLQEFEEVSEETLNRFNLSMDEKDQHRSSSESEMEEEEEEGQAQCRCLSSDEAKASWRETLQEHMQEHLYLKHEKDGDDKEEEEESSDEEEFPPLVSSAAESDITPARSSPSCITSITPSSDTPSTDSSTTSASTPSEDREDAPLTQHTAVVVMDTAVQGQPAGDKGSLAHDSSPELKKPLLFHDRGAGPDGERVKSEKEEAECGGIRKRSGPRGAHRVFRPPQSGGEALICQLKGPKETPTPREVEVEGGGARSLWRSVFSGNRMEKKEKRGNTSERATVRRDLTEESPPDTTFQLQRCSLKPVNNLLLDLSDLTSEIQRVRIKENEEDEEEDEDKQDKQELVYVPHALAFKRAYVIKKHSLEDRATPQGSDRQSLCPTSVLGVLVQQREMSSLDVKENMFQEGPKDEDKDLDAKITRRVQRAARRKAKQEQLKRLHKAQMVQRQLQQVEEKQRQLEDRGVMVEKALRGEADYWGESNASKDVELHLEGLGKLDNPALMQQWFQLVQQKNSLVRYESELIIFARELELEDRQSRLQQELRERMAVDDHLKEEWELLEERLILEEMLEVVEQRDSLVSLLEEQRLQQRQEDHDLEEVMMT